jgi:IPT/TIG domain
MEPGTYWDSIKSTPCIRLLSVLLLAFMLGGCGGGTSSSSSGGSGGSPPPPPPFQARPFPGDYFVRLPNQGVDGNVPSEAYDPSLKEVFVSNPGFNAVAVYSTVDGRYVGEFAVPGPVGLSFSPDYTKLVIGTITPYIYFADPAAMHVIGQLLVPASFLTTNPSGDTDMPVVPYAMADGSIMIGMGVTPESSSSDAVFVYHLVRYDSMNTIFTLKDPGPSGVGPMVTRSGDGRFLLTDGIANSSNVLFLYSAGTEGYVATSSAMQNSSAFLAANADGSQFASVQQIPAQGGGGFNSQVQFWGPTLTAENTYTISPQSIVGAPVFSRDGKYLYGITQNVLYALNTQTAAPAGYLGVSVGSLFPIIQIFDVDENYHLFCAISPGGGIILNASQLQSSPPSAIATFTGPSTEANPNVGPVAGGMQVQFLPTSAGSGSADGIAASMEAYFGSTPATADTVAPSPSSSDGRNSLTSTAPAVTSPGPVSVLLTDANNNPVFLPDAYTYGPHILRVEPGVATTQGGDQVTIIAYGFGFYFQSLVGKINVSIEGNPVDMSKAVLNSYASNTYPEQAVTLPVPPGSPGWADITVSTNNGADTFKRGFQYLDAEANLGGGPFTFAVYDSVRGHFYLTGNGSNVAVFDPGTQTYLQPLQSADVSMGAALQSEALTPDNNSLLVSDPTDQQVVIFDLVAGTSMAVKVILPTDPPVTLSAPMSIATSADNRAFVSLSPCIPDPVREIDLTNLTVQTRSDAASGCTAYVPYPDLGGSSGDGSSIIFAGNSGEQPPGPEYIWRYDAASDTFQGPSLFSDTPWVAGHGTADGDGGVIALSQGVLDEQLQPLLPIDSVGYDSRLNETGSLLYSVNSIGSGDSISISDTHNGRQLLKLALPSSAGNLSPYTPLAIDPTGQKILVATQAGVSYFQLSVIPLAVGTVSPSQGPAGTGVTLRGSGFVSGTTVKIGGQSAVCSFIDAETISCTIPSLSPGETSMALTNPDGQTYSFENAFTVQ